MPRKQDPRWGEDGYDKTGKKVEFTFDDEQWASIKEILGFQEEQEAIDHTKSEIEYVGSLYVIWHSRGVSDFTRGQARQALEELLVMDFTDLEIIQNLNERALSVLIDQLWKMDPERQPGENRLVPKLFSGPIDHDILRNAIDQAATALENTKGPDRDGVLYFCVGELCRLYETITNEAVTHSNKKELGYRSDPQSRAGRFIAECFKAIDSKVMGHTLSGAMRFYIESR